MRFRSCLITICVLMLAAAPAVWADSRSILRTAQRELELLRENEKRFDPGNFSGIAPLRKAIAASETALQDLNAEIERLKKKMDPAPDPLLQPMEQVATDLAKERDRAKAQIDKGKVRDALKKAEPELTEATRKTTEAEDKLAKTQPPGYPEAAAALIRELTQLGQLADKYRALPQIAIEQELDPTQDPDKKQIDALKDAIDKADVAVASARQKTAGDRSRHVTRVARLFFFQDAEHMLRNLAGEGRTIRRDNEEKLRLAEEASTAAREASRRANDDFTRSQIERITATEALQQAQKQVEEAKIQLARAQAAEAASKAALDRADTAKTAATRKKEDSTKDRTEKQAHFDKLKMDSTTKPEDLKQAQEELKQAEKAETDATRAETDATNAYNAANTAHQSDATSLQNAENALTGGQTAQNGALAQREGAETAANTAATASLNASLDANRRAADLAEAKTEFRNTPAPWVAVENLFSTDPVDRVRIQADTGGVLILRGDPKDVQAVERIIHQRDRPSAQVRAIFWTLQINGAGSRVGTRHLKEAIEKINDDMMGVRGEVALSGTALRDAIIDEFRFCQKYCPSLHHEAFTGNLAGAGRGPSHFFFSPEVAATLRLGRGTPDAYLRDFHPMNLATFGEAAAVLAMARREHQVAIIHKFWQHFLPKRLAEFTTQQLILRGKLKPEQAAGKQLELARMYYSTATFPRLRNYFHYDLDADRFTHCELGNCHRYAPAGTCPHCPGPAVCRKHADPAQCETADDCEIDGPRRYPLRDFLTPEQREIEQFYAGMLPSIWLYFDGKICEAEDAQELGLADKYRGVAGDLRLLGLGPGDRPGSGTRLFHRQEYRKFDQKGGALDRRARIAAMDAVLRRLMQATEADLEAQVVYPALYQIREHASACGITLGAIERNGIIAMNRSPARVDPRATFEIQLPQKVNFLKEVKNAASLAAAVQSGAFSGLISQLEQTRPSNLDDQPGTYFVESGNEVEFTPIVGPDGQAIRMQVRFHRDNPVRLPNRETGQNFGKIERHNIDTDVQDTNFELIEIARFEGQTTIGENRQRKGGIPILNQIPVIQDIPFIGYFTRERESVIGQQESLIFLQTAVYPSISDLIGLFAESEED